jgi:hypothetical protein
MVARIAIGAARLRSVTVFLFGELEEKQLISPESRWTLLLRRS